MKYRALLLIYKLVADWVPRSLGGRVFRREIGRHMFQSCGTGLVLEKNNTPHRKAMIGDHVQIGASCRFMIAGEILLEDNVLLAPEVVFVDSNHRMDSMSVPISRQGWDEPKPIRVGEGAWIGIRAIVLPGVDIGTGSVVAAGAVVVSDVPDFAIVGGNPAKILRYRTPELKEG